MLGMTKKTNVILNVVKYLDWNTYFRHFFVTSHYNKREFDIN